MSGEVPLCLSSEWHTVNSPWRNWFYTSGAIFCRFFFSWRRRLRYAVLVMSNCYITVRGNIILACSKQSSHFPSCYARMETWEFSSCLERSFGVCLCGWIRHGLCEFIHERMCLFEMDCSDQQNSRNIQISLGCHVCFLPYYTVISSSVISILSMSFRNEIFLCKTIQFMMYECCLL